MANEPNFRADQTSGHGSGNRPDQGGNKPDQGGNRPDQGGNRPDQGGNKPDAASATDQGGNKSEKGSESAIRPQEAAEHLKTAAVEQAEEIRKKADSVRDHALNRVRRVSSMLQSASEGIREEDDLIAGFAERAARQIDGIVDYLGSTDPRVLARDAQRVARENPAWFFGGAFVIGLATARFLKSSAMPGSEGSGPKQPSTGSSSVGRSMSASGMHTEDRPRTTPGFENKPAPGRAVPPRRPMDAGQTLSKPYREAGR